MEEKIKSLIERRLIDTKERCRFKKAFIPDGWSCVEPGVFAKEVAQEIIGMLNEAKEAV